MNSLPTEMKVYIFSFLEPEIQAFARLVCWEWKEAIEVPVFYEPVFEFLVRKKYVGLIQYLLDLGYWDQLEVYLLEEGDMEMIKRFESCISCLEPYTYEMPEEIESYVLRRCKNVCLRRLQTTTRWYNVEYHDMLYNDDVENLHYLIINNVIDTEIEGIFHNACLIGSSRCLRYLFKRGMKPRHEEIVVYPKRWSNAFLKGYISYADALWVAAKNKRYDVLAWLRGEHALKEQSSLREIWFRPPPDWPQRLMCRDNLMLWATSENRVYGPYNKSKAYLIRCLRNNFMIGFRDAFESGCPWDDEVRQVAIEMGNEEAVKMMDALEK